MREYGLTCSICCTSKHNPAKTNSPHYFTKNEPGDKAKLRKVAFKRLETFIPVCSYKGQTKHSNPKNQIGECFAKIDIRLALDEIADKQTTDEDNKQLVGGRKVVNERQLGLGH